MSIAELFSSIDLAGVAVDGGIILLIAMTVIQISPLKINPWGWLAKKVGKALNIEIIEKVDKLEKDVQEIREETKAARAETTEQAIISCRVRILRFGDEIMHDAKHSKDHFDQTMSDIDRYEAYCRTHKDFANSITETTVSRIKEVYRRRCEKNDFD